ncbi:hypothetical protein Pst134EA_009149 [Puccinia striiformis f. sp. tritici]|uniref:hypothetical protein n=1 Tax=Puccinia striiformis f. sp. tritici TaxID=168172 RepID=UPI002008C597|nr:hypothetical protein Pst134EA_009149 [Puccinia striiformis f. sp. tritici]KAH9468613.1 hypothetical protein Pst134EA_009149 [Puccinia striiformis f. sp. tritici]
MASLISSTVWVKRGVAAQHPRRYKLDKDELERVSKLAGDRLTHVKELLDEHTGGAVEDEEPVDVEDMIAGSEDDEKEHKDSDENEWSDEEEGEEDGQNKMEIDKDIDQATDEMAQYKLDDYDKEESNGVSMGAFSNIKGLQFYQNPSDDPYVTLDEVNDDEDSHEREELEIYPNDNLIIAARTEDDVSQLDIYVYDQGEENLYVHHDLLLPAMPLCLEWIDFTPAGIQCEHATRKGSFIAVGTMDPEIEIWNLDVVDGLYPDAILGDNSTPSSNPAEEDEEQTTHTKKNKKKKNKKSKSKPISTTPAPKISATSHTSSVLSLSHNKSVRNLLLSASADTTIKLWDLNQSQSGPSSTFKAIRSFDIHTDKVQSIQWNPKESSIVLSGGWDGMVKVWDSRNANEGVQVKLSSDIECLRWDPFNSQSFIVTLDNGLIQSYDSRMLTQFDSSTKSTPKALWTLSAHDSSVSAFDISPTIPGLLVSGGLDKLVKVWNLEDKSGSPTLSMVVSRDLGVGKVFSVSFSPDDPTTLAVAGTKGSLQIWDISTNNGVRSVFKDRFNQFASTLDLENRKPLGNSGVLSVVDDIESDDDDDGN